MKEEIIAVKHFEIIWSAGPSGLTDRARAADTLRAHPGCSMKYSYSDGRVGLVVGRWPGQGSDQKNKNFPSEAEQY